MTEASKAERVEALVADPNVIRIATETAKRITRQEMLDGVSAKETYRTVIYAIAEALLSAPVPCAGEKIAELEAALEPFAKMFDRMEEQREKFGPDHWPNDHTEFVVTLPQNGAWRHDFKFGDLRRAASAMLAATPSPPRQGKQGLIQERVYRAEP